jgi:hypothetical protein
VALPDQKPTVFDTAYGSAYPGRAIQGRRPPCGAWGSVAPDHSLPAVNPELRITGPQRSVSALTIARNC